MEVKVGNESKWICMCGLSNNQPFCDGSHKKTADEQAGKIYRYSQDGTRTEDNNPDTCMDSYIQYINKSNKKK